MIRNDHLSFIFNIINGNIGSQDNSIREAAFNLSLWLRPYKRKLLNADPICRSRQVYNLDHDRIMSEQHINALEMFKIDKVFDYVLGLSKEIDEIYRVYNNGSGINQDYSELLLNTVERHFNVVIRTIIEMNTEFDIHPQLFEYLINIKSFLDHLRTKLEIYKPDQLAIEKNSRSNYQLYS